MEVKINIDEMMFKDVLENELKAFSKEELHEIIRECIAEALRNNTSLKNLFVTKDSYWCTERPSDVMIYAARSMNLSPAFDEIQEKMITELKENYHVLLEKILLQALKDGLTNNYRLMEELNYTIENIVSNKIEEKLNG